MSWTYADPRLPEHFWQKVVRHRDCWIWVGSLTDFGHGQTWDPDAELVVRAHRYAYLKLVGPVPDGLVLDHAVCNTPCCCRPDHLVVTTDRENVLRGSAPTAVNARKTHCVNGHEFTPENISWQKGKRPRRACRECKNAQKRERRRRNRERSAA